MAEKKAVKRKKAPPLTEEALRGLGVIEKFDVVPSVGQGTYPWATVGVGEKFNIPIGTRSCVARQSVKTGKVFVTRAHDDGTATVYCTGLVVAPAPSPVMES